MNARKLQALVSAHAKRRWAMQQAAETLVGCYTSLAAREAHLLEELLEGRSPEQWAHYPEDDVIDPSTGFQYYYHSHAPDDRTCEEHGHFHLFARTDESGNEIDTDQERQFLSHFGASPNDAKTVSLLCLSLDARGVPAQFFTVNRWVTGDRFLDAASTLNLLDRFSITASPSSTVSPFLAAMIQLFWPQITNLLNKRDEKLLDFVKRGKRSGILEDQRTEVLTRVAIDVDEQLLLLAS
jgi:hypothetical protein